MQSKIQEDFYCSEKFTWLSVDLEKRQTFSCCAARPEQVNLDWVKQNPGQLFNTPLLQKERQLMLSNQPVESCEEVCWKPERSNIASRRQILGSASKTHLDIEVSSPKKLNIVLGSNCNLTCSYCCKNYSSAWSRDLVQNGSYLDQERFQITAKDKLLAKISQNEHQNSDGFKVLLDEIQNFSGVQDIYITGGEPFLYNGLPELLNQLAVSNTNIICYSGLGVDPKRFQTQLQKIKHTPNITITVSGETCNEFYEFNRYGNTWDNFLQNLTHLQSQNFYIRFSSVFSNLTVFGFLEFFKTFGKHQIEYQFCNVPDFLSVNVLDNDSKHMLIQNLSDSNLEFKQTVCNNIAQPCTEDQRKNLSTYIKEFARRRNLNLDIYPAHFCKWLEL